jgi:UPF0176 protein
MSFVVATFYHFFAFPDYVAARQPLLTMLKGLGIKGSLLIAAEGMNGTLSGTRENIDDMLAIIARDYIGGPFEHKESFHDVQPFIRTKVRLKKEIIALGEDVPPQHINSPRTGHYVEAKDWNAVISDPDTVVLDTRNSYEVHLGTFENAIDPNIRTFKFLPDYVRHNLDPAKHKKVATFCTGGIRCEKFSAWLLDQGFEDVYQLKGGILKYLEEVPEAQSKWQGECFVFDKRIAVGHGLKASQTASMCYCGHPLTPEDMQHPDYKENESCAYCCADKASA